MQNRYDHTVLIDYAVSILEKAGLPGDRSAIVAKTLVTSDLMGHTTHGLQLLPLYAEELLQGKMSKDGEPSVIRDGGSQLTWNGRHLPGPYLVEKAIDIGLHRLESTAVFSLAIQESHHIACLAAYLERVTDKGIMIILYSSDPLNKTVAPFGGVDGVYSPDPLAYGIPTHGDPILFDSSASTVANGVIVQKHKQGEDLDGPWLMDAQGNATNRTSTFFEDPPSTVLPVGGMDLGFKGFGLAIMIEALTSGLAGFGRHNDITQWSSSIFMQLIDPDQFGGRQHFQDEMQHLADKCMESTPRQGFEQVRMPGSRALERKRHHLTNGLVLHPGVEAGLKKCSEKYGISLPEPLN